MRGSEQLQWLLGWNLLFSVVSQLDLDSPQWRECPQMLPKVLVGYAPRGNESAGVYKKSPEAVTISSCVALCCEQPSCNIVFMFKQTCFQIECESDSLCEPVYREGSQFGNNVRMVLVRPVIGGSWGDITDVMAPVDYNRDKLWFGTNLQDLDMAESNVNADKVCVMDCPEHEHCSVATTECVCDVGYLRNRQGDCISAGNMTAVSALLLSPSRESTESPSSSKVSDGIDSSSKVPVQTLHVSVLSKVVRLPENGAALSAYTIPAQLSDGGKYNYEWTLISQPEGSSKGTMTDKNGETLKLSNLSEGVYEFKVAVSGPGVYGEAFANVTVMPPKRINKPPVAIVKPASKTVKLPNTGAVLDGSSSYDDAAIIAWHWELQKGPLGYQPTLQDSPTLVLNNLNITGNYTFTLTVEDSDHEKNSTVANITVLQMPDYPPVANAGQDVILYLPHNNVTLNGSLSSDDKAIVSWEWTKSPSDQDKAVDMQKTRTPYLELSNLEEGMYTFILKVTDEADQSDTSTVHVFVKPPTNKPPSANAGTNITVSLPQTTVLLDGSKSSDDIKIVSWSWEMVSGPGNVEFSAHNESVTNVTGLTKGQYVFKLTVTDGNGNIATNTVGVTVTQNSNSPPKANAGGDHTVELPVDVLVLNGSQSRDDLAIAKWLWTREPTSLAIGTIIAGTDTSPTLMLTNVVAGRYLFRLRVTDEQGEWDEDTVSVIVKPDPHLYHLVELTLNIESSQLTKSRSDSVVMKLGLLLRDAASLVVRALQTEAATGRAVLVFYVTTSHGALPGPSVVRTLRNKLAQDSVLLQLSVANIQTTVCQNNCSGHGVCDQATRQCMCEAFWMQDLFRKHFGDGDSNCDWSILYVVIALFTCFVCVVGCVWGLVCVCSRLCLCCQRPSKRQRYALLDNNEDSRLPLGKVMVSESESDSDILFESRKPNKLTNGDARNGVKNNRPMTGFKMERRVKT
ncbi:dyslexia-associated protein KIAA0319-like [Macrosteles quadrilineatus]|uniref:dyslexia-associated protein KIAA0319-like n=1 Tax=Macrosteles quadrilineatus TaxID=74068 RepID=UPI0023E1A2C1|nr:dyslexia-associated protein KIAA0319-like [Macrosteles quadrilineatus]XP_054266273.1 dyslexia-associated protein KIAA0319-like [Macrosteles quadrilineatus]XP_054266274.1 dyslexia-associated protein KIAA0319-like [Macrosteles quadrilineatus]XP_054269842.1 dyslexia-associated protein KIAA0319-like [Macrosteles quadrilineatus]XP_054289943.1 dyslexia-associated protein KIAA0319-like [Macrosteles quadrilineatus]